MIKLFLALAISYSSVCVMALLFQDKLLFFPDSRPFEICSWLEQVEGKIMWDKKNNVRYYFQDKLGAKANLIHFHGNAGSACDRTLIMDRFKDFPVNIILVEYPGYAGDRGKRSEKEFLANAESVLKKVKAVNPDKAIFLYGESLGTGIVTYLASKNEIKGLILQSPYPSLEEVGKFHYPFLPLKYLMKHNFPLQNWAKTVKAPVLILHGKKDNIIPYALGRKASTFFTSKMNFKTLEERGHNDLLDDSELWNTVKSFLQKNF